MKTTGAKNTVNQAATEATGIVSNASDYGSNLSQPGDGGAGCVHQLFEALAAKEPERLAVTSRQGSLTYGELNARAEQLSARLLAGGVGLEMVVGLCVPRSAAMLVGATGILKSGAAYLPIDPSEPEARSEAMLTDAGVTVLVTERSLKNTTWNGNRQVILMDQMGALIPRECEKPDSISLQRPLTGSTVSSEFRAGPKNLAYVIYTSGSTGTPKGVEITHESLSNLVSWHQGAFQVTSKDRAS